MPRIERGLEQFKMPEVESTQFQIYCSWDLKGLLSRDRVVGGGRIVGSTESCLAEAASYQERQKSTDWTLLFSRELESVERRRSRRVARSTFAHSTETWRRRTYGLIWLFMPYSMFAQCPARSSTNHCPESCLVALSLELSAFRSFPYSARSIVTSADHVLLQFSRLTRHLRLPQLLSNQVRLGSVGLV